MPNSRTLHLLHDRGGQGTGSLQSWHANEYDVASNPTKPEYLPNALAGPLGMFPMLDVMPGAASAMNDGLIMPEWGQYVKPSLNMVTSGDLDFEISHGALMGYKTGTGGDNAFAQVDRMPKDFGLANRQTQNTTISVDNVDHQLASALHGWHAVDESTLDLQKKLNFNHSIGDQAWYQGRGHGLERQQNPAVGEFNARTIPANSDTVVPMVSPDEIMVNEVAVNPEDTAALGVQS